MRKRVYLEREEHAGNWNILVPAGKEKNLITLVTASEKVIRQTESILKKNGDVVIAYPKFFSWSLLERSASESESLVNK